MWPDLSRILSIDHIMRSLGSFGGGIQHGHDELHLMFDFRSEMLARVASRLRPHHDYLNPISDYIYDGRARSPTTEKPFIFSQSLKSITVPCFYPWHSSANTAIILYMSRDPRLQHDTPNPSGTPRSY